MAAGAPVQIIDIIDSESGKEDDDVVLISENVAEEIKTPLSSKAKELSAEKHKEDGNTQYKLKQYSKALKCYSEAISLCPNIAAYYGNRAACYMMLNMHSYALEDAKHSINIDPNFSKGIIRMIKCNIALGDTIAAKNNLRLLQEKDPNNPSIEQEQSTLEIVEKKYEEFKKCFDAQDYRTALFHLERALDTAVACKTFKLLKAECLANLNRLQEAQEIANSILATDKQNADAVFVRGLCLYFQDNMDSAANHFQLLLKLAPDHAKAKETYRRAKLLKAKKDEGNDKYLRGANQDAYNIYSEALKIDPRNINVTCKLLQNRATVLFKMGKFDEAIADCNTALEKDPNYMKAFVRRSRCYYSLKQYEECVQDAEKIYKMDSSRENRKFLEEAKLLLKRSLIKDYYKILGITKNATTDDIKKAYRKRAMVHHPDRHINASQDEKQTQEKLFKEVGEAYGILSDPNKRSRYDQGEDIMDDSMGGGMGSHCHSFDHQNLFQHFYASAGGPNVHFQYHQ